MQRHVFDCLFVRRVSIERPFGLDDVRVDVLDQDVRRVHNFIAIVKNNFEDDRCVAYDHV